MPPELVPQQDDLVALTLLRFFLQGGKHLLQRARPLSIQPLEGPGLAPKFQALHAQDRGIPQRLGDVRAVPVESHNDPPLFPVPPPSPHGTRQFRTDRFETVRYLPQGTGDPGPVLYHLQGIGRRQRLAASIGGHDEIGALLLFADERLEQGHRLCSGTEVGDPLRLIGVVDEIDRTQECLPHDRFPHFGFWFSRH